MDIVDIYRPETAVGGFARDDEAIEFYCRVNALITQESTVVDLGAGRGQRFHEESDQFTLQLCRLQGKVKKMIGIDVDDAIGEHPFLDERHVIGFGDRLPLESHSIDLMVSEWTLEHVEDAQLFAQEIVRVLKPGGWFCALTPNAYGYVGIANRVLSSSLKQKLIKYVWPGRQEIDVFPTHYQLNTNSKLCGAFLTERWSHYTYTSNPTPKYFGKSTLAFNFISLYQQLMPNSLKTNMLIFIQKKG